MSSSVRPVKSASRPPLTLRIGGICWIVAGVLFAAAPLLAVLLTQAQIAAIGRQIARLSATAAGVPIAEIAQLQEIVDGLTSWIDAVWQNIGWIFAPLIAGYAFVALIALTCYIVFSAFTMRGAQWARILSTVLCAISTPAAIIIWLSVASLSWLPLNALWANHVGLALIVLQLLGLVLVWLPPSNAYVRAQATPPAPNPHPTAPATSSPAA